MATNINISRNQKINTNNFIHSFNTSYLTKYDCVEQNSKNNSKINNLFSKANLKTKKIYNYKYFSNFKDIANRNQIEINLNKENTINSEGKIFNSINFSFKKSRKKIRNEKLKLQRSENIQKIKSNKNNSDREK